MEEENIKTLVDFMEAGKEIGEVGCTRDLTHEYVSIDGDSWN